MQGVGLMNELADANSDYIELRILILFGGMNWFMREFRDLCAIF